ncbi:phosphotransferase [Nesterenkonia muleiensis]|uniref:phosphotransferase n=1 Tax=Nesterenkonia muleiensis TaxID=2282648 RepID=UPI000E72CE4C|nr:phosphotransferase [Nesterenkonia muleiensis]
MNPRTDTYVPSVAEADALVAEGARLDRAEEVIDSSRLSALLERHVTITHARLKPEHSVVVAHTELDGTHGWTMLTTDPDKFSKAQQRAAETGDPLSVHQQRAGLFLCTGSAWSDPALAKELAEAQRALEKQEERQVSWQILRYNPRRRLVAIVDAGKSPKVVRILAGGADHLLSAARRWRELGLPVTNLLPLGDRRSATIAPLWGFGDLARTPYEPASETAGEVIGRLHASSRSDSSQGQGPPEADPLQASAALHLVAPWLSGRAEQLALRCLTDLRAALDSATAEVHGDLSPDQVLLAAEGSHKVRIIDLDRAGPGHPMRDIGSWVASCRHAGHSELIDAFLAGYSSCARLEPADLNAWEAYAHLARATDFFRHREPDWPVHTVNALNLAEEALDR